MLCPWVFFMAGFWCLWLTDGSDSGERRSVNLCSAVPLRVKLRFLVTDMAWTLSWVLCNCQGKRTVCVLLYTIFNSTEMLTSVWLANVCSRKKWCVEFGWPRTILYCRTLCIARLIEGGLICDSPAACDLYVNLSFASCSHLPAPALFPATSLLHLKKELSP